MSCNYTKKHIVPVFGKEPETGIFIAKICEDWHFVAKIRKDWHFVAKIRKDRHFVARRGL